MHQLFLLFAAASWQPPAPRWASTHRLHATMCAEPADASSSHPSFRQRLREVHVSKQLLDEAARLHSEWKGRSPRRESTQQGRYQFGVRPQFKAAAATEASLPAEGLPEIAFIGRSNVGKSSLLNKLTGAAALAHVSDKPGRTQQLVFFEAGRGDDAFTLVDMPGYGFALAADETVAAWQRLCAQYFRTRSTLKLVLVLADARFGLKPSDVQMLEFLDAARVKYVVVLTKADLAGPPRRLAQIAALVEETARSAKYFQKPIAMVSSRFGSGIDQLQRRVILAATGVDPFAAEAAARAESERATSRQSFRPESTTGPRTVGERGGPRRQRDRAVDWEDTRPSRGRGRGGTRGRGGGAPRRRR